MSIPVAEQPFVHQLRTGNAYATVLFCIMPWPLLNMKEPLVTGINATRQSSQYQSYLLRLWSAGDGETCRVTLTSIHNPENCRHFASLDELVLFLHDSLDQNHLALKDSA